MTIDTHDHVPPDFFWQETENAHPPVGGLAPLGWSKEASISFMDDAGIDIAFVSLSTPGVHTGDSNKARALTRRCNEFSDELSADNPAPCLGSGLRVPTVSLLFLALLLTIATPRRSYAQVQLPAVNLGETNFEDGFASPGWILEEFPDSYIAGDLRNGNGSRIPGQSRLVTYSTTTHVVFVSKKRILGGWLAAEVLQPLVDLDLRSANGTSSRVSGFGDMSFGPALQWVPKKIGNGVFVHRFVPIFTVPTGTYSDLRPVNIGNHFVAIDPYYAVTYERKKMEFSARVHYLWNSTNHDPYVGFGIKSIQPGQAFHINYASSYRVSKSLRLGFNGYWLQQTTDHRINDVPIRDSKERTVGLGPGMQFGGPGIWFHLNAYLETDVRNRPGGVKVTMRVSKVLPAKEP